MATISSDGPFSLFDGIDRSLAVLEGEGIVLSVDGLPDENDHERHVALLLPGRPEGFGTADLRADNRP